MTERAKKTCWTHAEITALIDVWESHLPSLRSAKRNRFVYSAITSGLKDLYGVTKSPEEVHNKIKNLQREYRYVYNESRKCVDHIECCTFRKRECFLPCSGENLRKWGQVEVHRPHGRGLISFTASWAASLLIT